MLIFILLSCLLRLTVRTEFNMYNTDKTYNVGNLHVNCLYYNIRYDFKMMERVEYCLDSNDTTKSWADDFVNTRDRNFTFEQLHEMKITANDLLSWSATIDLAEKYQYYLDHQYNSPLSKEIFFNCTKPWFGSRCQYSFLIPLKEFHNVVYQILNRKFYSDFPSSVTPSTCYTQLTCDRGGSSLCLDWREICDGRIDCLNGGIDEAQCIDLEINECDENQYRCYNGLCIPKEFLGDGTPECLDQTDLPGITVQVLLGISFNHEDQACRPGDQQFSCGDGRCVADFAKCYTKRHLHLYESISLQGNLSSQCWMIMICLTKILDQVNGTTCNYLLNSSNISIYLKTCPTLIRFPTVAVLFGHVHFLYSLDDIHPQDIGQLLIPTYVCYDEQLCDFLPSIFRHGNYSCQYAHQFGLEPRGNLQNWTSIIGLIEPYFRKCSIGWNQKNHSSLYKCKNSSKFISIHRIFNGVADCYFGDDEEQYDLSCTIPNANRLRCGNEQKCYPMVSSRRICPAGYSLNLDEIEFHEICNRNVQVIVINHDGTNYTDETECEHWSCNNYYTRCDGFWNCPDGDDEKNCTTPQLCPIHNLPCVSPSNYTLSCLPASQVGDGHIDCLGAADEHQYCRNQILAQDIDGGFYCRDNKCFSTETLCDNETDCRFGDDELFCEGHYRICDANYKFNLTMVEKMLCRLDFRQKRSFSWRISSQYPSFNNRSIKHINHRTIEQHSMRNYIANQPDASTWYWLCNYGLYVRHWLSNNSSSYKCFCPPSYYGDFCQYQNQRVSFTAQIRVRNYTGIYVILVTLITDDGNSEEINSYQQFIAVSLYGGCGRNFNAYLTYSRRPKDVSKNYSIRVDAYDTNNLTYLSSWHFSIPFIFLPVNRMAMVLDIPAQKASSPIGCSLTCEHGNCLKYINKNQTFCRCDIGWSGARCDIPIRCGDCSSDSVCAGVIHNRSICICPLNKGGPRCLLQLSCQKDLCDNNATCFVLDDGFNTLPDVCICPEEYGGQFCELRKSKLEIFFNDIEVSSYLLAYIMDTRSQYLPYERMLMAGLPKKLKMFQRTVTLYVEMDLTLVFIMMANRYYLGVLQYEGQRNISTSISAAQRCKLVTELLNSQMSALPQIRRVKYYHILCKNHSDLMCFYDEQYMCLCTVERYANCFNVNYNPPKCRIDNHCLNDGTCLQFHPVCQYEATCVCADCFYGDRCQYYAEGIGLTLDDILRYAIQPNTTIENQSSTIKWFSAWTIIMFVVTLINSILSILTFITKESRAVGCGLYILASSITSLLTMCMFIGKFWFILLTQINSSVSQSVLRAGCISIEFILKICLFTDNWLNACVALERSITVYKEVNFNKVSSKRAAKWVIFILPLLIGISMIHEPINRDIFDDKDQNRFFCVLNYSLFVHIYNSTILIIHVVGPFSINLYSALFIIFRSARRRSAAQKRQTYQEHLREQLKKHKNLIISPIILIILAVPRLIISFLSGCTKLSQGIWYYLLGYFVSFIPSMSIFFVFVLPSEFYRKQFKDAMNRMTSRS